MTDISVQSTAHQVEKRSWQLDTLRLPGFTVSGTLDISAFVSGTHYPNGYIASGEPLGRITATGLYGPYDNAAVDGRETCVGLLYSSTKVPSLTDNTKDTGCAVLRSFAVVKESKLPRAIDSAGKADLKLIDFVGTNA